MCICPIQGTIQGAIKVSQVCLGSLIAYFVAKAEPKILRLVTGFRIILTDLKDKIFDQFSLCDLNVASLYVYFFLSKVYCKNSSFPDWKIDTELLSQISLSNWINSFLQNKC